MASHRAHRRASPTTIRRLSAYFRVLSEQERQNAAAISSERISELTGFTAAQVRRDLAYFGSFGKRGVGYAVTTLRGQLVLSSVIPRMNA